MPVNFGLEDKVIALTGAASGIGFETAKLLAAQGARLSVCDVNSTALATKAEEIRACSTSGTVLAVTVDVRDPKQVDEWIAQTVSELGPLDGGVNLAGIIPKVINIERIQDLNDADWHSVIDVNLHGVMHCMRAQLRVMNNKGSIVNASSICGVIAFPKNAAYTASKHAIIGLTRVAAKEVGDREIRCNAIAPGMIDTPMQRNSVEINEGIQDLGCQIKRQGTPQEVASLIAWLLCDQSQYITGSVQVIDGGWLC